jgi:hypothetical protein
MKKASVKIKFSSNPRVLNHADTLLFENYERTVRAEISNGNNVSCLVYMRPMPKSDMDQIIIELCNRIVWDGHHPITFGSIDRNYVFSGEPNSVDLVSEATYRFMV